MGFDPSASLDPLMARAETRVALRERLGTQPDQVTGLVEALAERLEFRLAEGRVEAIAARALSMSRLTPYLVGGFRRILDRVQPVKSAAQTAPVIGRSFDDRTVADGRPEGLAGIDLACSAPDTVRENAARRKLPLTDDYVLLVGMRCYLR